MKTKLYYLLFFLFISLGSDLYSQNKTELTRALNELGFTSTNNVYYLYKIKESPYSCKTQQGTKVYYPFIAINKSESDNKTVEQVKENPLHFPIVLPSSTPFNQKQARVIVSDFSSAKWEIQNIELIKQCKMLTPDKEALSSDDEIAKILFIARDIAN